jgi:phage-related protein
VAVEIVASARALAKSLKKEVESAFKDLDVQKLIQASIGNTRIKLPVEPDLDTDGIGEKVRRTRVPKVPVQLDPVVALFQAEVRRQTAALAREVAVKVPISADGGRLRAELGAELAAVQAQSKIKVPTEPGAKAEYEAKLKAQLAEVTARVRQHVNVDVDVDKGGSAKRAIGGLLQGIAKGLPGFAGFGAISSGIADLGGSLQKAAGSSAQLGGNLAGAFEAATGPIGLVIGLLVTAAGVMAALAGAATLVVPAMSAVAGAAAAIPAALVGAGAIFGTLSLGFKGISEAFKPKAGSGGGGSGQDPAQRARQIAAAERGVDSARRGITAATRGLAAAQRGLEASQRGLADAERNVSEAQKRATAAQQAVSKARVEATADIEDLGRALRGAQLDEEGAALAVTDALRELNAVKLTGNIPDIEKADLAYRQAQLTLENAKDTAKDLGDQQADSAKKGVEGSDKVVAALDAQAQAQQGVKDAQLSVIDAQNGVLSAQDALASANDGLKSSIDGLASAQDSLASAQAKSAASAAALAAKIIPLAPAAQKFVDAVKALKPAFEDLRLDVQQRLFAGLDKTVTNLGKAWIPALKVTLGAYAATFNGFFRNLGTGITTPKFISDIQAGAEGARQGLSQIGNAITSSLVPAFGALSRAAGPFLAQLGTEIANVVTEFSNWVLQGEKAKSGGLKDFFTTATNSMHDLFTTGKLVTKIIGDLFVILTGSTLAKGDKTPLDSFNDKLEDLHKFLSDPKNKAEITGYFDKIKETINKVDEDFKKIQGWIDKIDRLQKKLFGDDNEAKSKSAGTKIGTALINGIIAGIGVAVEANFLSLGVLAQKIVDKFKEVFGIKSPSTVMMEVGKNLIEGLMRGITDFLAGLATTAGQIGTTVINAVGDGATWLVTAGHNAVTGIGNGITSMFGSLKTWAGGIKTTITNALSTAGTWLVNTGHNAVTGLGNGIRNLYGSISSTASGLRTQITNALSNAANWLYNTGYNTVIGLWNGIASLGGWLYNKVVSFVRNNIISPVQNFLHISSPSKLAAELGSRVPQGLALGILGGADEVAAAAEKMAAAALPALADSTFGVDLSTSAAQASLTSSAGVELDWARAATGDPVLDAMRLLIKAKWRGNSVAALSTA